MTSLRARGKIVNGLEDLVGQAVQFERGILRRYRSIQFPAIHSNQAQRVAAGDEASLPGKSCCTANIAP